MSLISSSGQVWPKSKECTWTDLMNPGSVTCWNLSWINKRMLSAKASPSGPDVIVSQSISIDMLVITV